MRTDTTATGHTLVDRADRTRAIARVRHLENLLFDDTGHPRRHTSGEQATRLLTEINDLRHQLGWLCLDLEHHPCWPADAPTYLRR